MSSARKQRTVNEIIAMATCGLMFVALGVYAMMDGGMLSVEVTVQGSVSRMAAAPDRHSRRDGDWNIGIGWTPKPLRVLTRTADNNGQRYPALQSTYVDFDNARCRLPHGTNRVRGHDAPAVVRAPSLYPGDSVTLTCRSGVDLRSLSRTWACARLCDEDAPHEVTSTR